MLEDLLKLMEASCENIYVALDRLNAFLKADSGLKLIIAVTLLMLSKNSGRYFAQAIVKGSFKS